jgi:hypothetical protein
MFQSFANLCAREGVTFDPSNQRVRCLGHIINLAVQNTLKDLKAEGPNKETDLLDDVDNKTDKDINSMGTVEKVSRNH